MIRTRVLRGRRGLICASPPILENESGGFARSKIKSSTAAPVSPGLRLNFAGATRFVGPVAINSKLHSSALPCDPRGVNEPRVANLRKRIWPRTTLARGRVMRVPETYDRHEI